MLVLVMVSASVNKTVQMFGMSRGIVSKVMIAFEKKRKRLSKAQTWPKSEVLRERPLNFTSNC